MVAGNGAQRAVAGRINGPAGDWSPGGDASRTAGKPWAMCKREDPQPMPIPRPEPAPPDPDPRPPMPKPPAWLVPAVPEHGAPSVVAIIPGARIHPDDTLHGAHAV